MPASRGYYFIRSTGKRFKLNSEEFKVLQAQMSMTNAQLAEYLGKHITTVERWRQGKHKPEAIVVRLMKYYIAGLG